MDIEKIGKFIKELRAEKNLTQKQLADKLNITVQAVSKWERGKGLPDISYLEDLSEIFQVSILELLKGEKIENINKDDVSLSIHYGKEIEKEKTYEFISKLISVITFSIIILVVLFNIRNIYYANKTYHFNQEINININIKECLKKIEIIKNNQGIYNEEDYQNILVNLEKEEKLLEKRMEENFSGKYKLSDFNVETHEIEMISSIIIKYDKNISENYQIYKSFEMYNYQEMYNFEKNIMSNLYKYQLDKNNYTRDYLSAVNNSIQGLNILLDLIIEVGELNE